MEEDDELPETVVGDRRIGIGCLHTPDQTVGQVIEVLRFSDGFEMFNVKLATGWVTTAVPEELLFD
jgi:hypothetical protein